MKTLQIFRKFLKTKKIKSALITCPLNVRYLSGFQGGYPSEVLVGYFFSPEGFLLVTPKEVRLIVDSRYEGTARKIKGVKPYILKEPKRAQEIAGLLSKAAGGRGKVAIESRFLTFEDGSNLLKHLKKHKVEDISNELFAQRSIKTEAEIDILKKAVAVTDKAFGHILGFIRPGQTESQVAKELEQYMARYGMGLSFKIIVASGPNSAIPHHLTGTRKLRKGDMVIIDFGALHKGYHADMTRTIFIGKPSTRQLEVYNMTRAANEECEASLYPGMKAADADAICRTVLGGYAKYFTHSLGHGVGLVIHEDPKLSGRSRDTLEPGMVFSIEPGVYIPNWGGVRIEDLVLMTKKGPKVLSKSTKAVITI